MTKVEAAIQHLREAPAEVQEALAAQIEAALGHGPVDLLGDEELAEIAECIDEAEVLVPHEDVMRKFSHRI